MSRIDELLALARTYGDAVGIPLSTVSWRVFGDSKKLGAIAAGADLQTRRCERAISWFSQNWPAAPWPRRVSRPAVRRRATS